MSDYYRLEDHTPVPCTEEEWIEGLRNPDDRIVRRTTVEGGILVSTVFLALDHGFRSRLPVLFETLVFDGPMDGEMDRYTTWDDAVAGHADMVARVRRLVGPFCEGCGGWIEDPPYRYCERCSTEIADADID